jgi:hypothetical protein
MNQLQAPVEDLLVYHPEVGNIVSFWELFGRQLKTVREQRHRGLECGFGMMRHYLEQIKPIQIQTLSKKQLHFKRAMEKRKSQIKRARKKKKLR